MTDPQSTGRRPGELDARELLRWAWRQLTSMRTALILLLLLALAAVPGSVIPQEGVDSLKTSNWKDAHPKLTPLYEKLDLFHVYSSPWFAAVYVLLMVSLVGCIVPRLGVYWRALRAQPPGAPRRLMRLPDAASYATDQDATDVLARAERVLRKQRYRVRVSTGPAAGDEGAWVAAERGYLREAGNLLFHLSVIVVLVGFAVGSLFGYKGGVITVVGGGFTNQLTQYDDFVPGSLFKASSMEPFSFDIKDFHVDWLDSGPRAGMARGFASELEYCRACDGTDQRRYDLKVNHPLNIGRTEVFLIGHGYAPVITIRDGRGKVAYSGPTIFLPMNQSFFSFGVVKAPFAEPQPIGLEGAFYPTFLLAGGDPVNVMGDAKNPLLSLNVYAGDLNLDKPQSVYILDKSKATQLKKPSGQPLRLDLAVGDTATLPDGLGTVTFNKLVRWNKLQISQTPGKLVALTGVVLALVGLLGSLFIRPRRVWVRVRPAAGASGDAGAPPGRGTIVEVAALDRSGGGDVAAVVSDLITELGGTVADDPTTPASPRPAATEVNS